MTKTLSFTLLLCLFFSCLSAQNDWKIYRHKNGFSIQLPPAFSKGVLVAGGTLQWFDNHLDSSIELTVETFGNGTVGGLQGEFDEKKTTFATVSYQVLKPSWFVISGSDEQGICYLKTILKDGVLHCLRISYPSSQRGMMDKWIPKIAASFK